MFKSIIRLVNPVDITTLAGFPTAVNGLHDLVVYKAEIISRAALLKMGNARLLLKNRYDFHAAQQVPF